MLATPPSWLLALDRWLCVPAFQRVCSGSQGNMPKKIPRDKRGKAPVRTRAGVKSKPTHPVHSVKDLLQLHLRPHPGLASRPAASSSGTSGCRRTWGRSCTAGSPASASRRGSLRSLPSPPPGRHGCASPCRSSMPRSGQRPGR